MPIIFSKQNTANIINLYTSGIYAAEIARRYGVSKQTIYRLLKKNGVIILSRANQHDVLNGIDKVLPDIATAYKRGESVKAISNRLGIDRTVIKRRLIKAGSEIRGRSDAERLKWKTIKESREAVERQCGAAWQAVRGSQRSNVTRRKWAISIENSKVWRKGMFETEIAIALNKRGIATTQQRAINIYNTDIALDELPIAVEIYGARPASLYATKYGYGTFYERCINILDLNWCLLNVIAWGGYRSRFNTTAVADKIVSLLDLVRGNKSTLGKYGVITGDGEVSTMRSMYLNNRTRITGF